MDWGQYGDQVGLAMASCGVSSLGFLFTVVLVWFLLTFFIGIRQGKRPVGRFGFFMVLVEGIDALPEAAVIADAAVTGSLTISFVVSILAMNIANTFATSVDFISTRKAVSLHRILYCSTSFAVGMLTYSISVDVYSRQTRHLEVGIFSVVALLGSTAFGAIVMLLLMKFEDECLHTPVNNSNLTTEMNGILAALEQFLDGAGELEEARMAAQAQLAPDPARQVSSHRYGDYSSLVDDERVLADPDRAPSPSDTETPNHEPYDRDIYAASLRKLPTDGENNDRALGYSYQRSGGGSDIGIAASGLFDHRGTSYAGAEAQGAEGEVLDPLNDPLEKHRRHRELLRKYTHSYGAIELVIQGTGLSEQEKHDLAEMISENIREDEELSKLSPNLSYSVITPKSIHFRAIRLFGLMVLIGIWTVVWCFMFATVFYIIDHTTGSTFIGIVDACAEGLSGGAFIATVAGTMLPRMASDVRSANLTGFTHKLLGISFFISGLIGAVMLGFIDRTENQ